MLPLVRHRRRNDIVRLIGWLGGHGVVPAFYDVRYGITTALSGTVVSSWADARGASGFAPALTAAGTKRPAWDGSALTITFDEIDDCLGSVTSALFDLAGAYTYVLIASFPASAGASVAGGIADSSTPSRELDIKQNPGASTKIRVVGTGGSVVSGTVDVSTTRRCIIIAKNASTTETINIPSTAEVSGAISSTGAGNNAFSVGNVFTGASRASAPVVRAALALSRQATASDVATIFAWARTYHAAVAA